MFSILESSREVLPNKGPKNLDLAGWGTFFFYCKDYNTFNTKFKVKKITIQKLRLRTLNT